MNPLKRILVSNQIARCANVMVEIRDELRKLNLNVQIFMRK